MDILEKCKSKLEKHNFKKFLSFHNLNEEFPFTRHDYIWEYDENGYTLTRNEQVVYIEKATGKVYKLTTWWNNDSTNKLKLLEKICEDNQNARIEKLLHYEIIKFMEKDYYYLIFERPNKELGTYYLDDILLGKDLNLFFNDYINETYEILKNLNKIVTDLGDGLPSTQIVPNKLLRDSIGYFWMDIKHWVIPQAEYLKNNLYYFELVLKFWKETFPDVNFDYDQTYNLAKNKWGGIYA